MWVRDVPKVLALTGQVELLSFSAGSVMSLDADGDTLGILVGDPGTLHYSLLSRHGAGVNISDGSILGQIECSQNRTLC